MAAVRAVRKRERGAAEGQGKEEDDEVDDLFAEPAKAAEEGAAAKGALYEMAGVFAPRLIMGTGAESKFVFVLNDKSPTVSYFALEQRLEMHDWFLDNRGLALSLPKKHRIASRPETEEDAVRGEIFWQRRFGDAEEYEDEPAAGGSQPQGEEEEEEEQLDLGKELAASQ